MTIDKQFIEASLQNLHRQRRDALNAAVKAEGAIEVLQQALQYLEAPEPEQTKTE